MSPEEFWLTAATWGSYMTGGDPGACMYGFDERGAVQSEQHRKDCIEWLDKDCRKCAASGDDPRGLNEEIDNLIAYLRTAPVEPKVRHQK